MEIPGQPYAFLGSRGFRSLLHQGQTLQLRSQTRGDDPCQRNTFVELAGGIDHENLASIANNGKGTGAGNSDRSGWTNHQYKQSSDYGRERGLIIGER